MNVPVPWLVKNSPPKKIGVKLSEQPRGRVSAAKSSNNVISITLAVDRSQDFCSTQRWWFFSQPI